MIVAETTRVLRGLLAAEQRGLALRVVESAPFVSGLSVRDAEIARRIARERWEHAAWLTQLLLDLGSPPGPRALDVRTADLHFLELRFVLPRLIADEEAVIRLYEQAASNLAGDRGAAELASRILARHRTHLELLKSLANGAASTKS